MAAPRDIAGFRASVTAAAPPAGLDLPLQSLWWDAKGDWARAHACAQDDKTPTGARVHAYLHRVEGDLSNAGYWYNRAGAVPSTEPLTAEWESLATALLAR